MKRFSTLLLIAAGLIGVSAHAQDHFLASRMKSADDLYNSYQFPDAIEAYKKEVGKRSVNQRHVVQRIADSYRRTGQYGASEEWYARVVQFQDIDPVNYYYYAKALSTNKKHEQAAEWFKRYAEASTKDRRAKEHKGYSVDEVNKLLSAKEEYAVSPITANTGNDEFSPSYFGSKVIFVSNRPNQGALFQKTYGWTETPYLDLYEADAKAGRFENIQALQQLNTAYHEGPVAVTADGKRMYLTVNALSESGKPLRGAEKTTRLQIAMSNKITVNGEVTWSKPEPLTFNDPDFSCLHPTLSADGRYLFFASDRPGGYGGMDIWYCENYLLSWSAPKNLGPAVNTEGDEIFPFLNAQGNLYFASNGHLGVGGLDIFVSEPKVTKAGKSATEFVKPENLGYPMNDVTDDFGLVVDKEGKTGYFSSNRVGGKGGDDIYYFEKQEVVVPEPEEFVKLLELYVYEKQSGQGLPNAVINVFTDKGKLVTALQVNDSGYFAEEFLSKYIDEYEGELRFIASYGNYSTQREIVNMLDLYNKERSIVRIPLSRDLGKELSLNPIYFDLDKSNIRPDAAKELNKIVDIMQKNPELVIEVGSHTDSRGSNPYNQALSDRRAKSSVQYITEKGIQSYRVYGKGYGETQLTNECEDGVICDERKHQMNRRTEFKVVRGSVKN